MTIQEIKNWYAQFRPEHGTEELLKYRQYLSIAMFELAQEISILEAKHKDKEASRKIQQAIKELESDEKTASAKRQDAIKRTRDLVEDEARYDGELRGYKIQYEALNGISHSMASYLNKM